MKQEKQNKNRLIALIATVGAHLLLLLVLLFSYLHYKWPPDDMPLPKDSEILFGGEYVMYGDMNLSNSNDIAASNNDAAVVGDDATDAGEAGDNANLVTTDNPSSMTVKKTETPEKRGPTKEELAEQERIKRQQEEAERINRRVAFGKTGSGSGKTGSPSGNDSNGASNGAPGHSLSGRTLESWGRPSSGVDGVVIIKVRVNAKGHVIDARYQGGSGSAAASKSVRESCVKASLQSRFSVSTETTTEQVGTITWRFE